MLVKSALDAHALEQSKRYRSFKQRKLCVGASEIGLCLRRIWYGKQKQLTVDTKHDEAMRWGAMRRGSTFENHFWLPAMRRRYGDALLYTGSRQVSMVKDNLRATPDGLLIDQPRDALHELGIDDIGQSGEIVVECKTIDPRINLSTPKPEHEFQAQVQLALFRVTTRHRPTYAVIAYTNASFFDDIVEFPVKYDPAVYRQAILRANAVLKATAPGQLEPEGWISGGRECRWCSFASECAIVRGVGNVPPESPKIIPSKIAVQITKLARLERAAHTRAGAAEDEQRKLQESIKTLLREHGLRRVAHDGIVIVWSPVKGRPAFDMVALRAAAVKLGLDIQKFETVGQPTDRLTITVTREEPTTRTEGV